MFPSLNEAWAISYVALERRVLSYDALNSGAFFGVLETLEIELYWCG